MASKTETDRFVVSETDDASSEPTHCYSDWWHQGYRLQQIVSRVIESNHFRALVILLVVADTALVVTEIMLDSFKSHYECELRVNQSSTHRSERLKHRIELTMEIIHYCSIGILTFFVIELLVQIYALGKKFWNIRRKKMEYFDAFIVITSLAIDLFFLHGEKKIVGERLLLVLTFRLWRFVRIVSSELQTLILG